MRLLKQNLNKKDTNRYAYVEGENVRGLNSRPKGKKKKRATKKQSTLGKSHTVCYSIPSGSTSLLKASLCHFLQP